MSYSMLASRICRIRLDVVIPNLADKIAEFLQKMAGSTPASLGYVPAALRPAARKKPAVTEQQRAAP